MGLLNENSSIDSYQHSDISSQGRRTNDPICGLSLNKLKLDVTKLFSQLSILQSPFSPYKYVEGLSYEEIAEFTGIGVSAVKMRIASAKRLGAKLSYSKPPAPF